VWAEGVCQIRPPKSKQIIDATGRSKKKKKKPRYRKVEGREDGNPNTPRKGFFARTKRKKTGIKKRTREKGILFVAGGGKGDYLQPGGQKGPEGGGPGGGPKKKGKKRIRGGIENKTEYQKFK